MARVVRTAATRPGPNPPTQAVRIMARKKMGATSASGRTSSATISATATLETARPYLHTADDARCAELSDSVILLPRSDKDWSYLSGKNAPAFSGLIVSLAVYMNGPLQRQQMPIGSQASVLFFTLHRIHRKGESLRANSGKSATGLRKSPPDQSRNHVAS